MDVESCEFVEKAEGYSYNADDDDDDDNNAL